MKGFLSLKWPDQPLVPVACVPVPLGSCGIPFQLLQLIAAWRPAWFPSLKPRRLLIPAQAAFRRVVPLRGAGGSEPSGCLISLVPCGEVPGGLGSWWPLVPGGLWFLVAFGFWWLWVPGGFSLRPPGQG